MEGEEKGEKFHTFSVSDDSGQVSDETPFVSSGSCEEERVSSLFTDERKKESPHWDRTWQPRERGAEQKKGKKKKGKKKKEKRKREKGAEEKRK